MRRKNSYTTKIKYVILDNLRSGHNVGAIFRTAEAAGAAKIFLVGTTATPIDRFGRGAASIKKAALGAEKYLSWEYRARLASLIKKLKKEGVQVVGVEQAVGAVDFRKFRARYPAAFIFGNEIKGLSQRALGQCDAIIEIPMRGRKESLNVAVAAGVVLFGTM